MSLLTHMPFFKSAKKGTQQVISDSWHDRGAILNEEVNLFCWKRPVNPEIHHYLEQLTDSQPARISFRASAHELSSKIETVGQQWYLDTFGDGFYAFWKDVESLVGDFLSFSLTKQGNVYLKMITDDACAKFHTDGYDLRLFTTYYGGGTEWIPEKATNRKALGKRNELIVKDASQIQRMDPFEVGILKGEPPGNYKRVKGIVHRSPEMTPTCGNRIILRVDI